MSRILRRPMFRGGKVVSSYGNGIASGLANGGRVGYKNAGIVTLQDLLSQTNKNMSGADILKYANKNNLNLGNDFKINEKSIFTENEPLGMGNFGASPSEVAEVIANPVFREEEEFEEEINAAGDVVYKLDENEQRIPIEKNDYSSNLSVAEKIAIAKDAERDQQGSDLNLNEEVENISGTNILEERANSKKIKGSKIDNSLVGASILENQNRVTDDSELTADEVKEALGIKKAFRRDLGDTLARTSAAFLKKGDIKEGFAELMDAESKAGPSRTEKIEQGAATFMLKNKAQKASDERKIKMLMADTDYKIAAGKKLDISEGILAATKGGQTTDKKLAIGIQSSTSSLTGKKYKFKGVIQAKDLSGVLDSGQLKLGDTLIVKQTIEDKDSGINKTIKKIIEIQADGKSIQEIYKLT